MITKGAEISQAEKRQIFVDGLAEKARFNLLTREEAFIMLQGVLAETLTSALPGLEEDAQAASEGAARDNAMLFLSIARDTRDEMLSIVDHAISKRGTVKIVPWFKGAKR